MNISSLLIYIAKCASRWSQLSLTRRVWVLIFVNHRQPLGFTIFPILLRFVSTLDLMAMRLLRLSPGCAIPLSLLTSGFVSLRGQCASFLLCSSATVCPRGCHIMKGVDDKLVRGSVVPLWASWCISNYKKKKWRMPPLNKTWENLKR